MDHTDKHGLTQIREFMGEKESRNPMDDIPWDHGPFGKSRRLHRNDSTLRNVVSVLSCLQCPL
jgi:hypothetical protein